MVILCRLDREHISRYTLVALAVDRGSPPRSSSVTVIVDVTDVDDNPPRFPSERMVFKVKEDVDIGDVVATVQAHDPDLNTSPISYELNHDPLVLRQWHLDSRTGELSLNKRLDYETETNYSITVSATSNGLVSWVSAILLQSIHVKQWLPNISDRVPFVGRVPTRY